MANCEHELEFGAKVRADGLLEVDGHCSCGANFVYLFRVETQLDVGWAVFRLWRPNYHFAGGAAHNNYPPCHATIALTRHLEKECV